MVRYYYLTCHYKLLYDIIACKQSQYIAAYFSMQETLFYPGNYSSSMPLLRDAQSAN